MRGRLAVGRGPLEAVALVRIQPPQPNKITKMAVSSEGPFLGGDMRNGPA